MLLSFCIFTGDASAKDIDIAMKLGAGNYKKIDLFLRSSSFEMKSILLIPSDINF